MKVNLKAKRKIIYLIIIISSLLFFTFLIRNYSFYKNGQEVISDYKNQKAPEHLRVIPLYLGRNFIKKDLGNMIKETNSLGDRAVFLYLLGALGDNESRNIIESSLFFFNADCDTALMCIKALVSIDGKSKVKLKYKDIRLNCFFSNRYVNVNKHSYPSIAEIVDNQIEDDLKYNVSFFDIFLWWTDWKPDSSK